MSTNHIDTVPGPFSEGRPGQNPKPISEDVSRVLRLLDLPELRLDTFSDEESLRILDVIQRFSGDTDDEFRYFISLPTLICQAHQATEAAENDLFETFAEIQEVEDKLNAFPEELDYDDDHDHDYGKDSNEVPRRLFGQELPRLDKLTLAMRKAHVSAAEGREERADLTLEYLGTWLKILAPSPLVDAVHENYHGVQDMHAAREVALAEAYWLLDAHPRYEVGWDDELVWDFLRDGRTALDLMVSRGAIIISDTDNTMVS